MSQEKKHISIEQALQGFSAKVQFLDEQLVDINIVESIFHVRGCQATTPTALGFHVQFNLLENMPDLSKLLSRLMNQTQPSPGKTTFMIIEEKQFMQSQYVGGYISPAKKKVIAKQYQALESGTKFPIINFPQVLELFREELVLKKDSTLQKCSELKSHINRILMQYVAADHHLNLQFRELLHDLDQVILYGKSRVISPNVSDQITRRALQLCKDVQQFRNKINDTSWDSSIEKLITIQSWLSLMQGAFRSFARAVWYIDHHFETVELWHKTVCDLICSKWQAEFEVAQDCDDVVKKIQAVTTNILFDKLSNLMGILDLTKLFSDRNVTIDTLVNYHAGCILAQGGIQCLEKRGSSDVRHKVGEGESKRQRISESNIAPKCELTLHYLTSIVSKLIMFPCMVFPATLTEGGNWRVDQFRLKYCEIVSAAKHCIMELSKFKDLINEVKGKCRDVHENLMLFLPPVEACVNYYYRMCEHSLKIAGERRELLLSELQVTSRTLLQRVELNMQKLEVEITRFTQPSIATISEANDLDLTCFFSQLNSLSQAVDEISGVIDLIDENVDSALLPSTKQVRNKLIAKRNQFLQAALSAFGGWYQSCAIEVSNNGLMTYDSLLRRMTYLKCIFKQKELIMNKIADISLQSSQEMSAKLHELRAKFCKLTLSESFKAELVRECLPVLTTCQSELEARHRSITPMIVYLRGVLAGVPADRVDALITSTNADNRELLAVQKIANDAEKITEVLNSCGVLDDSVTELSRAISFFREYAHSCSDVVHEYANLCYYFQVSTALKIDDEKKTLLLSSVDIIINVQNEMVTAFNHYINVVSQTSMEKPDFDSAMRAFSEALEEADRLLNNHLESEFPIELKKIVVYALNDIAGMVKYCREYISQIQHASPTLLRTKN